MNLKKKIESLPGNVKLLLKYGRQINLFKHIIILKIRSLFRGRVQPSPEITYWVAPERIVYHTNYLEKNMPLPFQDRVFDPLKDRGKVYDGNWDITSYKFSDLLVFKALEKRITVGLDWEETEFFQVLLKDFEKGITLWGCANRKDLVARCQYLDNLIKNINKNGYRLNYLVKLPGELNSIAKTEEFSDEISVNIGRNGQYLFQDGRHRLAIAQILGLDKIAVKVLVRHKKWVELRESLKEIVGQDVMNAKGGNSCKSPLHPDLHDVLPFNGCDERFDAVSKRLHGKGSLLDLSGNLGFYSHKFEELGYVCTTLVRSPKTAIAVKKLREASGKKFSVITGDLLKLTNSESFRIINFDVVLVLAGSCQLFENIADCKYFIGWLNSVKVKEIFYEMNDLGKDLSFKKSVLKQGEILVKNILENSTFNHAEIVYFNHGGGKIFRIYT